MRVILLQDVPKIGKKYEVREVKNGLARNFLIPKKMAEVATAYTIKRAEKAKAKSAKMSDNMNKEIARVYELLKDKPLVIETRANEQGNLFAAISEKDIAGAIQKQHNVLVSETTILLNEPIKRVGEYTIALGDKQNVFTLQIYTQKNTNI